MKAGLSSDFAGTGRDWFRNFGDLFGSFFRKGRKLSILVVESVKVCQHIGLKWFNPEHDAVIRVYHEADNVIETQEHTGRVQRTVESR
jgi:hypothetical protein